LHQARELKKLIKIYPLLRTEIIELDKELAEDPTNETPLGDDVYKISINQQIAMPVLL